MNVYSYSILCCFAFLTIISYQDFRKLKIKADTFVVFFPVATFHWLIMDGLDWKKIIDLGLMILYVLMYYLFYKKWNVIEIGSGDMFGLVWLTLFVGHKNSLFIYLASILLFIFFGSLVLFLTKKSIKTKLPFMPYVWIAFCLFYVKGWI